MGMPSFFRGHKKARSFGETAPLLICCCNHITGRAAEPAPFSDKFLNVFSTVCYAGEERPCRAALGGGHFPQARNVSAEPPETSRHEANCSGRGESGGIFFRGLLCEKFSQPR